MSGQSILNKLTSVQNYKYKGMRHRIVLLKDLLQVINESIIRIDGDIEGKSIDNLSNNYTGKVQALHTKYNEQLDSVSGKMHSSFSGTIS